MHLKGGKEMERKLKLKYSTSLSKKVPGWKGGMGRGVQQKVPHTPKTTLIVVFNLTACLEWNRAGYTTNIVIVVCGDSGYSCSAAERSRTSRWLSCRQTHCCPFCWPPSIKGKHVGQCHVSGKVEKHTHTHLGVGPVVTQSIFDCCIPAASWGHMGLGG